MIKQHGDGESKLVNLAILTISCLIGIVISVSLAHLDSIIGTDDPKSPQKSLVPTPTSPQNSSLVAPNSTIDVEAVCSLTDYPTTCKSSLSSLHTASAAEYAVAAVNATIQQAAAVAAALKNESSNAAAIRICNELMDLAIHDLNFSLAILTSNRNLSTSPENFHTVMDRLSAAVAYQISCRDGLRGIGDVRTRLGKPIKMTSNSLAIVNSTFNDSDETSSPIRSSNSTGSGQTRPDAVVAADGSGEFRTISEALSEYKLNEFGRFVVYVKAGEYNESFTVAQNQINVTIYGDGANQTVVYGSKSTESGITAYETATVAVLGDGFVCRSMSIQNRAKSAGNSSAAVTAVAIRVQADRSVFYNCTIEGRKSALYALVHRQFYRGCKISGSADLIIGDAAAVIQDSEILVTGGGAVTAQGRAERWETTGFVVQNCSVNGIGGEIVLGRPWRKSSRAVVVESYLGEAVAAEGWKVSAGDEKYFYGEFENYGPGSGTGKRVSGSKVLKDDSEAVRFGPSLFIQGNEWIAEAGVPFQGGL
ncbi:Putative pectinesterase/pectinesterase inhibitor 28 [Linum perenne]